MKTGSEGKKKKIAREKLYSFYFLAEEKQNTLI